MKQEVLQPKAIHPRRIDCHTHILPKYIPNFKEKFGYGGFISMTHHEDGLADMIKDEKFFRKVEPNTWDPVARFKDMKRTHVDKQVLSTVPVMFSYWANPKDTLYVSEQLNNDLAETVKQHPDSFYGLGTLPMNDSKLACQEMRRCVEDLGMNGFQIGSHIGKMTLDREEFFPIFETAAELDTAIMIHPWDMVGFDLMEKYWLPWLVGMPAETTLAMCSLIFGGIFERLPNLRVMFAHGGGAFPFTIGRIEHGFNVRPDLCQIDNKVNPRDYIGRFWVDSITHDRKALNYLVDTMGEDKVILGSDYPFPLGEHEPGKLIDTMDSEFSYKVKDKLLYTNCLDWLGISKSER